MRNIIQEVAQGYGVLSIVEADGEAVMTATPGIEGVHEAWQAAEAEDAFWREHYSRLLEQFPDQFVAVHDGRVVATSTDLQDILRALDERGLDPRKVWVRFVTANARRVMP